MTTPNETTKKPTFWLRAIEHRKHTLGRAYRATLGDKAREGVSDEDYATTMSTLEKMARNLGWSDGDADGPFRGRGRGPRGMRHPGMMHGFGPRHPEQRPTAPTEPANTTETPTTPEA